MGHAIKLYNTLTQRLETLEPIESGHVRIYLCGLTTYDHAHAGHARTNIMFDVLVRFLRETGLRVTFVRNVTDVDDKILKRAKELGEDPLAFSRRMAELNLNELASVGCLTPDVEPRVSDHIREIVELTEELVARGHAYVVETDSGSDVYFSVRSFEPYGKLSKRKLDDLMAGARVDPGERKRDPLDFALWKASAKDGWGWDSPWGTGRPGWHIECSAMAARYLGASFDIHCGGMDLIFPHHENEIAQSEGASGGPFAKVWLHTGFLNVDSEKMSKSLGNFVTIRDVLARYDADSLRYFVLGAHYRGPVGFDVEKLSDGRVVFPCLDEAERRVEYLYRTRDALQVASMGVAPLTDPGVPAAKTAKEAPGRVLAALARDLNTPVALSVLSDVAKSANDTLAQLARSKKDASAEQKLRACAAALLDALDACARPLGLLLRPATDVLQAMQDKRLLARGLDRGKLDAMVEERRQARQSRDFAHSDAVRDALSALGVEILDSPDGATTWRLLA